MRRIVETCLRMAPLWMMSPSMGALVATRGASSLALPPPSSFARLECHARRRRRRRWDGGESFYSYAPSSSGGDDATSGGDNDDIPSPRHKIVHVPLVFVPGMKGTHLAFDDGRGTVGDAGDDGRRSGRRRERVWLTLGNLLHIPPRPDDDPSRDLSLPLTYDHDASPDVGEGDGHVHRASLHPRQHRGKLVPDGIVDHIIEFNVGGDMDGGTTYNFVDLNFLPFYGHVTKTLRDLDREYHKRRNDGRETIIGSDDAADAEGIDMMRGIFDRVGSFVERTSKWAFSSGPGDRGRIHHSTIHCRPTAVFSYDWRRPLPELCTSLHQFCEDTFPNQPVQILAHSLGGLMTFDAMRNHPEKYSPGAVVVGVPFGTGIQYLQDLHKGYFTELDRCRQFTPDKQFTMSSHWGFFPISKEGLGDRFVDVTKNREDIKFDSDKSGIGKKAEFQGTVEGDNAWFDFYSPDEWERLNIGIFGPEYDDLLTDEQREAYKDHMRIQMTAHKAWRRRVLGDGTLDESEFHSGSPIPPLVACASDAVPTVNQILRRRRKPSPYTALTRKGRHPMNPWEYDYVNGRAVAGDGRIDFDKAFPPFVSHKRVTLDSAHAKQMCWEENGGSWGTIYKEVVEQAEKYLKCVNEEKKVVADPVLLEIGGK